jgi:hypothetical protein
MRNLPITASTPTRRDVARCPLAQDVAGALVGAVVGRRPARLGTGGPATVYGVPTEDCHWTSAELSCELSNESP